MLKTIEWANGKVRILDQTLLPGKITYLVSKNYMETAAAIKKMKIRGAPAIGVAAAFGVAQAVASSKATKLEQLGKEMAKASSVLQATRPTAVNLAWGLKRMKLAMDQYRDRRLPKLKEMLIAEALKIQKEDIEINMSMGRHGAELLRDGDRILTHCNSGSLATAGHGTALGVVKTAFKQGKKISVWVDETRPYLQGARLTTLELKEARIPHTLITDNTAAALMARKMVDVVIVGADRITAQGDVANKIGTYGLAVLAYEHKIPFYVVAPTSTFDMTLEKGEDIVIEERSADEVINVLGKLIAPKGTKALHLSFDVTPHRFVSAIITEQGVLRAPFKDSIAVMLNPGVAAKKPVPVAA